MKLSQWAKQNGLTYRTAWNLFKENKLPVKTIQLESGTILVQEEKIITNQYIKNYLDKILNIFCDEFLTKEKAKQIKEKLKNDN